MLRWPRPLAPGAVRGYDGHSGRARLRTGAAGPRHRRRAADPAERDAPAVRTRGGGGGQACLPREAGRQHPRRRDRGGPAGAGARRPCRGRPLCALPGRHAPDPRDDRRGSAGYGEPGRGGLLQRPRPASHAGGLALVRRSFARGLPEPDRNPPVRHAALPRWRPALGVGHLRASVAAGSGGRRPVAGRRHLR